MKSQILFLFSLISFLFVNAQDLPDYKKRLKGVDKKMETILSDWNTAGFSVAVVDKNGLIYAKGFGFRDYEQKIPATENTLYAIGSCSKAFTSALIGILENQGKLKLTDHPAQHLTGLKLYNESLNSQLQIKDMMRHSTGLPRHDYSWYLFPTTDRDSLMMRLEYQEPFAGIRETWYYNNFMFLLQGMIAEELTDSTWEQNIKAKFFEPLGMKTSNASISELEDSEEPSFGYLLTKEKAIKKTDYYKIRAMAPAGSINSSVKEMSSWVQTWINGGKFEGKQIIPSNYVQQAISSQMIINANLPTKEHPDLHLSNYGYGWFVSSYKGHYRVEHGGNIDGFSANTSFFPSDSVGIIVLANQNGSTIPSIVRNTIADMLLGVEQSDWNSELKKQFAEYEKSQVSKDSTEKASIVVGTKPSHSLVEYTGTYEHPGYGKFKLELENDSLFAYSVENKFWLKHVHYDIFLPLEVDEMEGIDTTEVSGPKMNFITGLNGEIEVMEAKLEPALDRLSFKRTPKLLELTKEDLEKFVGEYQFPGATAKVYIKGKKTLCLLVPGQPEYELLPIEENVFSIKILEGFKVKFEEENDKISAFYSIQPNGTFKASRIEN